jgi:membrane associated rhomboid family serine protease
MPVVVWALVFLNAVIFLHQIQLTPDETQRFIARYAATPALLTAPGGLAHYWPTLFTYMFLHGGWLHVIGNMWFLWVFGDNVEDRFGSVGFLLFYLIGGIAAIAVQIFVAPHSSVPAVGASGSVAAVLGAYLALYPKAKVVTLIPIFLFPWFVSVPAVVWLGLWFAEQFFSGLGSLTQQATTGVVAYWAHISGFVFGAAVGLLAKLASSASAQTESGEQPSAAGRQPYYYGYDRDWPFA